MTKLEEIEETFRIHSELAPSQIKHLINRVKKLEAALEIYAMTNESFPEYGDVARKALEKSENK